MNHESESPLTPGPEPHSNDDEGIRESLVTELADTAPTRLKRATLLNAFRTHGIPFAAYLGLDGIDPFSEDIVTNFEADYAGSYDSKQTLMNRTLEDLGMTSDLEEFIDAHMEMAGLLTWDWELLWDMLQQRWQIIDIHGALYVFEP